MNSEIRARKKKFAALVTVVMLVMCLSLIHIFVAAEQSENKRAERKNGGRYYEVPEIKPGCTGGKRLEFKYTESECSS